MKYPIKKSYTVAAASLTGHAAAVTGSAWTIATMRAGDGLAHPVTVRNNTITDHSAKTITLTGIDAVGAVISETMAAPGPSATVTSTKSFLALETANPSATIGADTFDIGWAAAAYSPWIPLDHHVRDFSASVAVVVSGTIDYDLEHTYDTDLSAAAPFTHGTIDGKTVSAETSYAAPIGAVRVKINSHTGGAFALHVLQGER